MPSPLTPSWTPLRRRTIWCAGAALLGAGAVALVIAGCATVGARRAGRLSPGIYPPQPQTPRAIALGNLRNTAAPTQAQVDWAMFLFGAEPPAPVAIAKPTALAVDGTSLLICDTGLDEILRWNADGNLASACHTHFLTQPFDVSVTPALQRLVCDRSGVWRCAATGQPEQAFRLENEPYRPAGVLAVGDTVWVSNDAANRIEVFDLATGAHQRSIGGPGIGPGEFALPRGMARTPDGNVCIVDMLNNRVQVLSPTGEFIRAVGSAGDDVGCFGRPKGVAVGPDGTIFVTDAFSQRIQAFAPDGQALLAFGEPGSGVGALVLPNGIATWDRIPPTDQPLPAGTEVAYYVLVAEQLQRPGVRAYAWLGVGPHDVTDQATLPSEVAEDWKARFPQSAAINPHWDPERCTRCHEAAGDQMLPIPLDKTDALCVSCHDGVQAPADPHPIGRPAHTEQVNVPDGWPTVNDTIGCLTCHDIIRHCRKDAHRPAINSDLLRGFDPQRPLNYCTNCHLSDVSGRFSPHRQRDATGKIRADACLFCHTQRPDVPADGRRRFEPHLRVASSRLCLNCHQPHWDLSPRGHVDRPVTPKIREWMLVRELSTEVNAPLAELKRMARTSHVEPARLPLGDGKVTCYTCHNPHYTGLFPANSELGAMATNPLDRASALRDNWIDLCSECHQH